MISREEVLEANKRQRELLYKLSNEKYGTTCKGSTDHDLIDNFINQQPKLDSNVEEAIRWLETQGTLSFDIISKKSINTIKQHIQAFQSKFNKIEEMLDWDIKGYKEDRKLCKTEEQMAKYDMAIGILSRYKQIIGDNKITRPTTLLKFEKKELNTKNRKSRGHS